MEDIENKLINSLKFNFWWFLVATFLLIAILFCAFLFRNKLLHDLLKNYENAIIGKTVFIVLIGVQCLFALFFSYKFALCSMDLKYIKQRNFETITGKVIGYSSVGEGNDPKKPILGDPIFEIIGTGEKISLKVGPTQVNETYTVIYLKHSKIGEIVNIGN